MKCFLFLHNKSSFIILTNDNESAFSFHHILFSSLSSVLFIFSKCFFKEERMRTWMIFRFEALKTHKRQAKNLSNPSIENFYRWTFEKLFQEKCQSREKSQRKIENFKVACGITFRAIYSETCLLSSFGWGDKFNYKVPLSLPSHDFIQENIFNYSSWLPTNTCTD